MSVTAQQRQLAAAIRDGAEADGLLAGDFALGLQVYRHAYRARLADALVDNHTVLARALGDEAFDALAHAYIATHPSRHPSIRWFGHALADFMADAGDDLVPHESLIDIARMDWALRGAFDAADAPLLAPENLAALSPDDWAGLQLRLHPSVQRVALAHAVEPAWRVLREWDPDTGADQPELPEPRPHAHVLLAWRQGLETRWRSLEPLEATLLDAVAAGETFAQLCERAAAVLGDADAAAAAAVGLLQRWLADGLLQR
ncbi:DNA-binding domain-containing protein [Pelomonas cellulosilytica]|uniref:DNA-binding domain-containing protein n=1 Tax=Pelomonas cellulosilytica TaxID=2906762 RepID=A0ABS8XPU2_9BURK|nr:DNA-binding domain-containing protein [Pelomonas sp. P8]MCE4553838.1 DNA-binding domain-containing protein [Pelomonas sp. P8]